MKSKLVSFVLLAASTAFVPSPARAEEPQNKIYVQKLIEQAWAKFPDYQLTHIAIHAAAPGTTVYHEVARMPYVAKKIGPKTDDDDVPVATTYKPRLEPFLEKHFFELHIPLRDASGRVIGILGLAFKYVSGQSDWEFLWKGVTIRDALEPQISDHAQLFAPAS